MARNRRLNSDQLGAKGEQRFAELCADAQLEANKSLRDRTGWDFRLEFPFPPLTSNSDLAARPRPYDCWVQGKTVWLESRNIKLRLSSAERLAKERGASFICVLTVNDRLDFVGLYVMHVMGDLLDTTLKKLRKIQKDGKSTSINKEYMTLSIASYGKKISVSGACLRSYLEECIGQDYDFYISEKRKILRSSGFSATPVHGSVTVRSPNKERFADFFLGLTALPVVALEAVERRWDIDLPLVFPQGTAEVRIAPKPMDVQVIFRQNGKKPISFDMDLLSPVISSGDWRQDKRILKNDNLQIIFGGKAAHLEMPGLGKIPTKYSTLKKLNLLDQMVLDGRVDIQVLHKKRLILGMYFENQSGARSAQEIAWLKTFLDQFGDILSQAGADDVIMPPRIDDELQRFIQALHSILCQPDTVSMDAIVNMFNYNAKNLEYADILFVSSCSLGEETPAYYAIGQANMESTDEEKVFKLHVADFSLRQISLIASSPDDFARFTEEAEAITGVSLVFHA